MVWPFLMLFGVVMAVFGRSKVAACVLFAWVATQLMPSELILKFAMWQMVGTFIMFKLKETTSGALVIASGLCYPAAKFLGIDAAVGSLPFVLSDIAAVAAVLIGDNGGLVSKLDGKRYMGWINNRRADCYNYRNTHIKEKV